jgi:methyl-accepting chemotaxis protein
LKNTISNLIAGFFDVQEGEVKIGGITVSYSLNNQMNIINKSIASFKQIISATSDIIPKIEGINSSVDNLNI